MGRYVWGESDRYGTGRSSRLAGVALLLLLLTVSCGYHRPGQHEPGRPIPTVYLAALSNDTTRPGLQGTVAGAIQRQLLLDARIPVVDEPRADLILAGRVAGYGTEALAFDPLADIGRRFRLRVSATIVARERVGGQVRFEGNFSGEAYYTAADTVQAVRAAEEEAVRRAAQDMAAQLMARLLEEW